MARAEDLVETLHVELQDIGGTAWWARILTTLASQSGSGSEPWALTFERN